MAVDPHHAPIQALVRRIRRETGRAVPDVDPDGPGTVADVIVVLRDPSRLGALTTNVLSPIKNPDRTASNQRRLFAAAKLPLEVCLSIGRQRGGLHPWRPLIRRVLTPRQVPGQKLGKSFGVGLLPGEHESPVSGAFAVAGQVLNLRPPGYAF